MDLINTMFASKPQIVLGIGTGSTMELFIHAWKAHDIPARWPNKVFIGIPTSVQAENLIIDAGMILGSLKQFDRIDIYVDSADEMDGSKQCLLKGGGGAHLMERIVMTCAHWRLIVVEPSKMNSCSRKLGFVWRHGIPVSVIPAAAHAVVNTLRQKGYIPRIRESAEWPVKGPVLTNEGHVIVDLGQEEGFGDLEKICADLESVPGIAAHGLFLGIHNVAVVGDSVEVLESTPVQ